MRDLRRDRPLLALQSILPFISGAYALNPLIRETNERKLSVIALPEAAYTAS